MAVGPLKIACYKERFVLTSNRQPQYVKSNRMRPPSLGGLTNFTKLRCVEFSWVRVSDSGLRQYLEDIRPANTTVVTQLAAEGALIELEVTALRRKKQ